MRTRLVVSCLVVILTTVPSQAETPLGTTFTYQGQLKNSGSPASGSFNMVFQLFDALTLGNQIGPTLTFDGAGGNPPPVSVTDGLFIVPIDFGAAAFGGNKRWLSITVGGTALTPRQELTAAPNALNADRFDGLTSTDFLRSTLPLTLSAPSNTEVLLVQNPTNSSGAFAIRAETTGGLSFGNVGVFGQCAGLLGTGVYGVSTATGIAGGYGVQGHATSPNGRGVYGYANAVTGATSGVFGQSVSTDGTGVYGLATAANGFTYGGRFLSASTLGRGVYGEATAATGETYGGRFHSASTSGRGVYGAASAPNGETFGVFGESASADGRGVYGAANFGTGVYGESAQADGVYGIGRYGGRFVGLAGSSTGVSGTGFVGVRGSGFIGGDFESTLCVGIGVKGVANCETGLATGVEGASHSTSGRGVAGFANATTGTNNGVYGSSDSTSGRGVYGRNSDNIGVYGQADGTSGSNYGVYGESASTAGRGVNGVASAGSGANYGVRGATASASGYGVYSSGDFGASGTKAFRIDHPSDPLGKYLLHYSAESPFPQNFYSGNVVTNARGDAWVELPDYFAEINTNFKYQLTVVDGPSSGENDFVQVKVRKKIKDGRFLIRTSVPNVEVSWEVKADRNDLYVRRKQPRDVVEKQDVERGTYQHPELYGQPPEKGMDYDAECESPSSSAAPDAPSH